MFRRHDPVTTPVHDLLVGDLSDEQLHDALNELRAASEWIVLEPFDRPPERIVHLVYRPTGRPYAFHAQRLPPGRWRFAD